MLLPKTRYARRVRGLPRAVDEGSEREDSAAGGGRELAAADHC
jgi:hypothetical protein